MPPRQALRQGLTQYLGCHLHKQGLNTLMFSNQMSDMLNHITRGRPSTSSFLSSLQNLQMRLLRQTQPFSNTLMFGL